MHLYRSIGEIKPINLLADPRYVRAWPGGCGHVKMGSNYAPTLAVADSAKKHGCQQVLWLFGEDQEVTEAGAMNVFILWKNKETGRTELVTPPLDSGMILPGNSCSVTQALLIGNDKAMVYPTTTFCCV